MKGKVKGKGQVYVHVCKSKKKDTNGLICSKEAIKKAKKKNGKFSAKIKFFDFPEFWLNSPGTYYWQAFRIDVHRRQRSVRLQPGRADRQVQGRLTVRIGCSGWNYASWKETFYPPRLPARRWLEHYATQFDTVEVNATFYRLASPSAVDGWVHHTPPDFVFAVKSSRYLTHMKRLTDMDRGVGRFYDSIAPMVESPKLGPVLWQLPDRFARDDERLEHALSNLPPGRHAFELRHPSWFAEPVWDLLRSYGVAFVLHDDKRRRPTPEVLTADFTYLRFHYGRRGRRGNYSDSELREWASRVRALAREAEVFAYFNNDWEVFAPRNAKRLRALVN